MSTEPGKNKGGPPGADGTGAEGTGGGTGGAGKKPGAGSGSGSSKPGTKPAKTVAAASAKSGRDETTVDLDTSDAAGKPGSSGKSGSSSADTTRIDLAKIEDKSAKDSGSSEIAPVKDTVGDSSVSPAKPSAPSAAASSSPSSPSSSPSSSSGSAGWAKPAEPSGSVSAGRTESARKLFNRSPGNSAAAGNPAGGNSAAASSPSPSPSSGGSGRGFAGTVLKDRPSTAMTPANSTKPANGKPARKAQLQLSRLEPWSVMKFSFVMSLVCFVVLLVAVIVLYAILSGLGVFDAISDTINSLTKEQGETTGSVDAGSWFSFFRVFGYTVLVGALNVMLITALSTVGSVIYNLAADLVGGVEVTLKEAE